MERRPVGRPAQWHQPIVEYVEQRGAVRALDVRRDLGLSKTSLYHALESLVSSGLLIWCVSDRGNYRLIQKQVTVQRLDILLCSHN